MNTQLITNVNFVELSFFKVGTSCTILSHIYVIICIYKLNLVMDSTKTHTAVPEQNSKLNIYVYIQYTVTIQLFQLNLSQTIVRCTII